MSSRGSSVSVLILMGAFVTAATAASQDPPAARERVSVSEPARDGTGAATMQVSPSEVIWLPSEGHEGTALTVSGLGGVWVRQEFGPGEPPSFSALDEQGNRYPDGSYDYELRAVPRVRRGFDEDLAAARQAGDTERIAELQREATPDRLLMSGSFAIDQGSFVEPAIDPGPEPTPLADGGLRPITAGQQVINDDLVVDGTACIGYACVEDGDEGFTSELRLKGEGLSLFFEDTVGFTSIRDWEVRTGRFGGDYFEILDRGLEGELFNAPFRIQGGAPNGALVVSSNGNVAIPSGSVAVGTTVPGAGAKLHLFGFQSTDVFASAGTDPLNGPAFNFGYGGATFGRGAGFLSARPDASATAPNPSLRFLTNNVERMIITNTGNVGIGTSLPGATLHVSSGEVRLPGGTASANGWPTHFRWPLDGKNYIRGTTIIADDGGSVGIGTQVPSAKLHVAGSSGTTKALIQETSGTGAARVLLDLSNNGAVVLQMKDTAQAPTWQVTASNAFVIDNLAHVGVELQVNPDGALLVNGTQMNVPDYVFDPGYELLPLADLATFVEKERHLPNVPAAADIRANGLNLSAFPIQLLEKVEELALYVIAQQRQLDAVQSLHQELAVRDAEIAALQATLTELAARLEKLEPRP